MKAIFRVLRFLLVWALFFAMIFGGMILVYQGIIEVFRGEEVVVPELVGLSLLQAWEKVPEDCPIDIVKTMESHQFAQGTVLSQNPAARTVMKRGRKIHVVVSSGVSFVEVPSFLEMNLRDARVLLAKNNLHSAKISFLNTQKNISLILAQNPPAGTRLKPGEFVSFLVGREKNTLQVPDLRKKSRGKAMEILSLYGMKVSKVHNISLLYGKYDEVIDQQPFPGVEVEKGSAVELFVNDGGEKKISKNAKQKVEIRLPSGILSQQVKVKKIDGAQEILIHEGEHQAGETFFLETEISSKTELHIFLNDLFYRKIDFLGVENVAEF